MRSKQAPKMPRVPNEDGIERHDSYTRVNPKGHKEFVADADEETLNELSEDILRLLESINFGDVNQTGAGAGSPEQLQTDRRHNRLLPSSREEDDNNMTASEPLEADGPDTSKAKSEIGTSTIRSEGFPDKNIIRCEYTIHNESVTGTGAIAIMPGPLKIAGEQEDEQDRETEDEINTESIMTAKNNGLTASIQKLLNEWEPTFVAGEYSPGEGGIASPKGKGVQSSTPKQTKGEDNKLKNHGDAFGAGHNETPAMCDVDENGVENKPQGDHESSVGDPDDGHQTEVGHDWPDQPKHKGGSAEPVTGTRYNNGGTLGSVKEGWTPANISSLMDEDINIQDLFNAYAQNVNVVCVEDFQKVCNANGYATRLTDNNLLSLIKLNEEFLFYHGEDANGSYWQVTPIAKKKSLTERFQVRSLRDEVRGPQDDESIDGHSHHIDDMPEPDVDIDDELGDYVDDEGGAVGDGCPECGAYCDNQSECPECGCPVDNDSGEEAALGGSEAYIKDISVRRPGEDADIMLHPDDQDQEHHIHPFFRGMNESTNQRISNAQRLHKFLASAKGILESSGKGWTNARESIGEALAHSWKIYAEGIDPRKTPANVKSILEGLADKFEIFALEVMEGEIGTGGFKPAKLDEQPKPEDGKDLGEPLGKKQTNTADETPVIAGTAKGMSGKSTGKISKSMKENIERLSRHVQRHLKDSVKSLRGKHYPEYQVQVTEGRSVNLTPVRITLSEALADAEEILQYHDANDVNLKARFKDAKGEVVLVNDVPLMTINPRGLVASEGAILFRFKRNAERLAGQIVAEGKTCRVVPHNWGTAVYCMG